MNKKMKTSPQKWEGKVLFVNGEEILDWTPYSPLWNIAYAVACERLYQPVPGLWKAGLVPRINKSGKWEFNFKEKGNDHD